MKTEKEVVAVHVGPTAYLAEKGITLAKGDTLEILGSRVTVDEESLDQLLAYGADVNRPWRSWKS